MSDISTVLRCLTDGFSHDKNKQCSTRITSKQRLRLHQDLLFLRDWCSDLVSVRIKMKKEKENHTVCERREQAV